VRATRDNGINGFGAQTSSSGNNSAFAVVGGGGLRSTGAEE